MSASKTVQDAIKETYASLASAAAKRAVSQVEIGEMPGAHATMTWVERWLVTAGANATRWRYQRPS